MRTSTIRRIAGVALVMTSALAVHARAFGQEPAATSGDLPGALWQDPGPVATRDLFWGIGDAERAPKGPFIFVEEDTSGSQPKIVVTDSRGTTWDVKLGEEVHAEIAANRLVWAFGYFVEETYFVPSGKLDKWPALKRGAEHLDASGGFTNARFRRRDPAAIRTREEWKFDQNPFLGRQELSGLRLLMTMINNWDVRGATNNKVLEVTTPEGRRERRFIVGDLGATFGRMGGPISNHSKWRLDHFLKEGFIEQVKDGVIHLDYDGWDSDMDRVPIEHARWFASLASQLTPDQIRKVFEAAGAKPEEVEGYSKKIAEKIAQLQVVVR